MKKSKIESLKLRVEQILNEDFLENVNGGNVIRKACFSSDCDCDCGEKKEEPILGGCFMI